MVECESEYGGGYRGTNSVLIDTWWNVNIVTICRWLRALSSFNRYMVECESRLRREHLISESGFNRYMVECECIFPAADRVQHRVLIDTWWNVNAYYSYRMQGALRF